MFQPGGMQDDVISQATTVAQLGKPRYDVRAALPEQRNYLQKWRWWVLFLCFFSCSLPPFVHPLSLSLSHTPMNTQLDLKIGLLSMQQISVEACRAYPVTQSQAHLCSLHGIQTNTCHVIWITLFLSCLCILQHRVWQNWRWQLCSIMHLWSWSKTS